MDIILIISESLPYCLLLGFYGSKQQQNPAEPQRKPVSQPDAGNQHMRDGDAVSTLILVCIMHWLLYCNV